jgi:hypothetical protein
MLLLHSGKGRRGTVEHPAVVDGAPSRFREVSRCARLGEGTDKMGLSERPHSATSSLLIYLPKISDSRKMINIHENSTPNLFTKNKNKWVKKLVGILQ